MCIAFILSNDASFIDVIVKWDSYLLITEEMLEQSE